MPTAGREMSTSQSAVMLAAQAGEYRHTRVGGR